jgi:mitochondrial fission protein ELM1
LPATALLQYLPVYWLQYLPVAQKKRKTMLQNSVARGMAQHPVMGARVAQVNLFLQLLIKRQLLPHIVLEELDV